MGIQGNRYQLNERVKELEHKLKEAKEENENLKNNKGINLKNIDLTGISIKDQNNKISEEEQEFIDAVNNFMYDEISDKAKKHVIEEFYDTIQAKLGLLDKLGIKASEVMKEYSKHLEKLKNRPRHKKTIEENKASSWFMNRFIKKE